MEKNDKLIESVQFNNVFVAATFELYNDRIVYITKKKNVVYEFSDIVKVYSEMGNLEFLLSNGKKVNFTLDKDVREKFIKFISERLGTEKVDASGSKEIVNSKADSTNKDGSNTSVFGFIGSLIGVIFIGYIIYNFVFGGGYLENGYSAEQAAINLIGPFAKANELTCEAKKETDDLITLVECTTTSDIIIESYDSETIWYGYLESASGSHYLEYADSDQDVVLSKLRE